MGKDVRQSDAMGHSIQALVFPDTLVSHIPARLRSVRRARLAQGFVILPLTDEAILEIGTDHVSVRRENFTRFTDGVLDLARELSQAGAVAYVETDYFGGVGAQSAAAWRSGREVLAPASGGSDTVNAALRTIGVCAAAPADEFDAIGLGRHRHNEEWLEEGEPV